jgi:hypothetical protein
MAPLIRAGSDSESTAPAVLFSLSPRFQRSFSAVSAILPA